MRPKSLHQVGVAKTVAPAEHLHQPLYLLRFPGQAEVGLELSKRHVHLHARQVQLAHKAPGNKRDFSLWDGKLNVKISNVYYKLLLHSNLILDSL